MCQTSRDLLASELQFAVHRGSLSAERWNRRGWWSLGRCAMVCLDSSVVENSEVCSRLARRLPRLARPSTNNTELMMFGWRIYEGSACGARCLGKRSHCTRYKDTNPGPISFDRIAETIRLGKNRVASRGFSSDRGGKIDVCRGSGIDKTENVWYAPGENCIVGVNTACWEGYSWRGFVGERWLSWSRILQEESLILISIKLFLCVRRCKISQKPKDWSTCNLLQS